MTIVRKKRSQLVLWAVKLALKGVLCTRLSEELFDTQLCPFLGPTAMPC